MAKSVSLLSDWWKLVRLIVDVCIVLYLTGTCHNFKWIEKKDRTCAACSHVCTYIQWSLFFFLVAPHLRICIYIAACAISFQLRPQKFENPNLRIAGNAI